MMIAFIKSWKDFDQCKEICCLALSKFYTLKHHIRVRWSYICKLCIVS